MHAHTHTHTRVQIQYLAQNDSEVDDLSLKPRALGHDSIKLPLNGLLPSYNLMIFSLMFTFNFLINLKITDNSCQNISTGSESPNP